MNLSDVIAHHADRNPARLALSMGDEEVTYAQLQDRVERTAGALQAEGVGRGTVVGVLLQNCLEFLDVMLATAHLGGIFMPLNWRLAAAELAYVGDHAGAEVMVSQRELAPQLDALHDAGGPVRSWLTADAAEGRWRSLSERVEHAEPIRESAEVDGDDTMRLMYTSGTTSRPKGVMISYANLYWKCIAQVVELEMTHADRGVACGPLYHVGALDMTTTNMLYIGGSTHILPKFDPEALMAAIEARALTNVWLAPAMVSLLMASGAADRHDGSSLRLLLDGGEKMPMPLIQRILDTFPGIWFCDGYGMTETVSGDTYLDKGRMLDKLGSVGKPIPHTKIRIVDGADNPLPAGEVGEILIKGPKVCKGYWRDEGTTAVAMRGGWLHSGDLGYLDEDGFLFIVDRLKDMIISGGENVASLEVERVLYEHPGVQEVAVVGSPDPRWNEVPVAYVVVREGVAIDVDELDAFCRERLAKYKTPKGFRFVAELPRNPSGKVLKRDLRDREIPAADPTT
jgi:fatty-acyl-CoA synthase